MKKYIIIPLVTIVVILTSCQPTPEKPIVVNKRDDRLESMIRASNIPQDSVVADNHTLEPEDTCEPDPYAIWHERLEWRNEDKGMEVIVDINAPIHYPEEALAPVIRVKRVPFTIEDAKSVVNVFMEGEELYEDSAQKTKYDYLDDICRFKVMIENIKGRTDLSEDEKESEIKGYEELIERIQGKLDTVPTSFPKTPAKLEFRKANSSSPDAEIINVCTVADDAKERLMVFNTHADQIHCIMWEKVGQQYWGNEIDLDINKNKSLISNYRSMAKETLAKLGISDMGLSAISIKGNGINPLGEDGLLSQEEADHACYVFHFMREALGLTAIYTREMDGIVSEDEAKRYAPPYKDETIDIVVDHTGVIAFEWESPSEIVCVETDGVEQLSLDEIKAIFRKQIFISKIWTWEDSSKTIHIDKIAYGLTRIAIKDVKDEYRYVPSWTFFGYDEITTGKGATLRITPFTSYMTINAIDGSIINRELGY